MRKISQAYPLPYRPRYREAQLATISVAILVFLAAAALVMAMASSILELKPSKAVAAMTMRSPAPHRLVFQVSVNDAAIMQQVIDSANSAALAYLSRHEPVAIEIVANGPGVHMLRSDTSPVRDAVHDLRTDDPEVILSACGTTKAMMEEREGHAVTMLDGVRMVPAGIIRLVELQEQGWSSIRP